MDSLVFILLFSSCRLRVGQLFGPTITSTFTPTTTFTPTLTFTPMPTLTQTPTFTQTPTTTFTPTIIPTLIVMDTPSSVSHLLATCDNNEPHLITWMIEQNGMLFEAFICPGNGDTLTAIFHNQNFSDTITLDQKILNEKDYAGWQVYVDVDSDKKTGTLEKSSLSKIVGADYFLELTDYFSLLDFDRWSNSNEIEAVSFNEIFEINVWDCISDCIYDPTHDFFFFDADFYADSTDKLIILKGVIPQINVNSKIIFTRFGANNLTYQTDWITSKIIP